MKLEDMELHPEDQDLDVRSSYCSGYFDDYTSAEGGDCERCGVDVLRHHGSIASHHRESLVAKDGSTSVEDGSGPTRITANTIYISEDRLLSMAVSDPVNNPSHYTHYKGLEVIQLTEQMNFNRGNAVKYVARAGLKNPDTEIEDLEKAKWYIQREIDRIKEEN